VLDNKKTESKKVALSSEREKYKKKREKIGPESLSAVADVALQWSPRQEFLVLSMAIIGLTFSEKSSILLSLKKLNQLVSLKGI
jgi:hypothetical protein